MSVSDRIETVTALVQDSVQETIELPLGTVLPDSQHVIVKDIVSGGHERIITAVGDLRDAIKFEGRAYAQVDGNTVRFFVNFTLPMPLLAITSFFVHYGSYDELPESWRSIRVTPMEIHSNGNGKFTICKVFEVNRKGHYGATLYATLGRDSDKVWQGKGSSDDVRFIIDDYSPTLRRRLALRQEQLKNRAVKLLNERVHCYHAFRRSVRRLSESKISRDLGRIIFEWSKDRPELRKMLADHYSEALTRLQDEHVGDSALEAYTLASSLENIGIGEVVLVAPEGPHASLGGLAQVVQDLMTVLAESGLATTLITPLYENEQGSRHKSAATVLKEGIHFNGEKLPLELIGEIEVPFGPTYAVNSTNWRQHPHQICCPVYQAKTKNIKIIFIRHQRYSDYLYPDVGNDERLRRAVFLSRGALEIMGNPVFDVHAKLILSNDWLSALVPVLLKLDSRYSQNETMRDCRSVHMIHNCGRDYHGLLPLKHNNEEIWPMIGLGPEHNSGLIDPSNRNMLNLTAAAAFHLEGALIAVSKPYAQQLLTPSGGEGLNGLLESRRGGIFGISNAVNQSRVRHTIINIGEKALAELNRPPLMWAENRSGSYISNLLAYKEAIKLSLQKKLGLHQDANKTVFSFVGRLVEQKGIQLLNHPAQHEHISVMESILHRFPDAQFIIAGPAVEGDQVSRNFRNLAYHLRSKFNGRVAAICDFVPHDFAIEVLAGSDFTLMPSRFEPGGLIQLEALACGTLVIARNVGGIAATLNNFAGEANPSCGFLFDEFSSTALRNTIIWALDAMQNKGLKEKLIIQSALSEHDWSHRLPQYMSVFQLVSGVFADQHPYPHLKKRKELLEQLRA